MALFSVGSTVILADTNARGVVVEVKPARRSRQIYRVSFSDGIIDVLEPDLRADENAHRNLLDMEDDE